MHIRISLVALALIASGLGVAQDLAPIGIVRGDLLDWSGTPRSGELIFRNAQHHVYQCSFDEHTFFERDKERLAVARMNHGDQIEVLADRKIGTGICYARTVEVIESKTVAGTSVRQRQISWVPHNTAVETFTPPRGDMTLAGVVLRVGPDSLLLRTRTKERKTILLRSDTRYLSAGQVQDRSNLLLNTRVFVRAGKNLEDQLEAFQIIWGDILKPVIIPESLQ